MKRIAIFAHGLACHVIFFGTFCHALGFVGNLIVPKSMDSAPVGPFGESLLIDLALLGLFAVQHSVMARPGFKRLFTRIVPEPAERSTYVLVSSLAPILLFWQWRPLGGVIWSVRSPVGQSVADALFASGWLTVLVTTCLIGAVGVVVPGMPTTCFVIAASFFFPKRSPKMDRWLRSNRWLGPFLKRFEENRAMTPRAKAAAVSSRWLGIALGVTATAHTGFAIPAAMILSGLAGTGAILFWVRTAEAVPAYPSASGAGM